MSSEQGSRLRDVSVRECSQAPTRYAMSFSLVNEVAA